jgi:hypothetical protein
MKASLQFFAMPGLPQADLNRKVPEDEPCG